MRKTAILLAGAVLIAGAISLCSSGQHYEERLISIALKETVGADAKDVLSESAMLQALFLEYSSDPKLFLKARLALSEYGDDARNVLVEYGAQPDFKEVLGNYGEIVVPITARFMESKSRCVDILQAVKEQATTSVEQLKKVFDSVLGRPLPSQGNVNIAPNAQELRRECGQVAIAAIKKDGYVFLSELAISSNRKVVWSWTARTRDLIGSIFTSGIQTIETKYFLDQEIRAADVFWATVDASLLLSIVKPLRAIQWARGERAVQSGARLKGAAKEVSVLDRTKLFATRLLPKSGLALNIVKASVTLGVAYVVVSHPSLINSLLVELAEALGISSIFLQIVFWTGILYFAAVFLLPMVLPLIYIFKWALGLLQLALTQLGRGLKWLIGREDSVVKS